MSRFLYSCLWYVLSPCVLLYLLWRSRKDKAYRLRWLERFGFVTRPSGKINESYQQGLVIHAVSVGEVQAAMPFIRALLARYQDIPVTVTCTTPTASERIREQLGDQVLHTYIPLDFPGAVQRFLNTLKPAVLILMERELWPNLLHHADLQGTEVVVINTRLSQKSTRVYHRFRALMQPLWPKVSLMLVQDKLTLQHMQQLGFLGPIHHVGNIKFDPPPLSISETELHELAQALKPRPIWVAGSTHAGEDELLLQAFAQIKQRHPDVLLIIAPRHTERFPAVEELLKQQQWRYVKRSAGVLPETTTDVWLGDSLGDLPIWYHLADIAFIGGSLITRGGHNPLEAIGQHCVIHTGRHVFNFKEIYADLDALKVVNWVDHVDDLVTQVCTVISQPDEALRQINASLGFYQAQQGALERTLTRLAPLLNAVRTPPLSKTIASSLTGPACTHHFYWDAQYFSTMQPEFFTPLYWQAQHALIKQALGRHPVYFVQQDQKILVLRHYYRGGLVGRCIQDSYIGLTPSRSRAMQEFKLLAWMHRQGLPVPKPIAAHCIQRGIRYQANLLIEAIDQAEDIASVLSQRVLEQGECYAMGVVIAKLHIFGVYHSDLNCHNILLDQNGRLWLIDFDKCTRRSRGAWMQQNLARLQRSLVKESRSGRPFHWQERQWAFVLQGYQDSIGFLPSSTIY